MADLRTLRLPARFKVKTKRVGSCLVWTAGTNGNGYGKFRWKGKWVYAHRFAYECCVGPIPEGHDIDHLKPPGCVGTLCVEPRHLEPVTHGVNCRRGGNYVKTHCNHGHEYTPGNTFIDKGGARRCRQCNRDRMASRRRTRGAAVKPNMAGNRAGKLIVHRERGQVG